MSPTLIIKTNNALWFEGVLDPLWELGLPDIGFQCSKYTMNKNTNWWKKKTRTPISYQNWVRGLFGIMKSSLQHNPTYPRPNRNKARAVTNTTVRIVQLHLAIRLQYHHADIVRMMFGPIIHICDTSLQILWTFQTEYFLLSVCSSLQSAPDCGVSIHHQANYSNFEVWSLPSYT